jgi:NADH-ubiquinone oxidoreductase chain 5
LSALGTSLYSAKIIYYTFYTKPNSNYVNYEKAHEPTLLMGVPLIILAVLSIFTGYLFRDLFVGLGSIYFENSLLILPNHLNLIESEFGFASIILKILPLILSILGYFILVLILEYFNIYVIKSLFSYFNQRFYFEEVINEYIVFNSFYLGYISNKIMDRGIFEYLGPKGLTSLFVIIRNQVNLLETGKILDFAVYFIVSLCIIFLNLEIEYVFLFLLS